MTIPFATRTNDQREEPSISWTRELETNQGSCGIINQYSGAPYKQTIVTQSGHHDMLFGRGEH